MREELCRAFCEGISIKEVPAGLAVGTSFRSIDGDAIGFFITRNRKGLCRLEDDGELIPYLEACGVDLNTQTRARALNDLLNEYGAEIDHATAVIRTPYIRQEEVPAAALHFVVLLLRLGDLLLLTQEHVESAFREDASRRIRESIGNRATILEREPVSERLSEIIPDLIIRGPARDPVALFFGQTTQRINDALFLHLIARHEVKEPVSVVAMLETESVVSREMRQRVANRLSAVPVYKGDEAAAVEKIREIALGPEPTYH